MILVGYDEDGGASLYHIDYLGGMHKMRYGAHGYGGFFVSSLFDRCRDWRERAGHEESGG
jgi:20S proteasome subunit beta 4